MLVVIIVVIVFNEITIVVMHKVACLRMKYITSYDLKAVLVSTLGSEVNWAHTK